MPKHPAMSQVSRPVQIAFVAMVLFLAVWFVALRGHGGSGGGGATPSVSRASTPNGGSSASSGTKTYTGSAPGVAGLTRAIAKAHGAVTTSQQNAQQLQQRAAQAANPSSSTTATGATPSASSTTPSTGSSAASGSAQSAAPTATAPAAATKQATPSGSPAAGSTANASSTARQSLVQHELASGKVVALLFWNPKSSDDVAVRNQLHDLSRRSGKVAVHVAPQAQVASFGSYTRGVQVLQTPTILVIDKAGHVTALTGLTDARSLQQTIGDVLRGGAGKALAPTFTAWLRGSSRSAYIGRANALCESANKTVKLPQLQTASVKALVTSVHGIVNVELGVLAKLRAIAPPSADRAYIDQMIALEHRSLSHLDQAGSALAAGNRSAARVDVLKAQALDDQATNGIYDYGLTACAAG
jgi:hypothetical protein